MKHVVIIGTGLAGYTLAKAFRRLDQQAQLTLLTADEGCFYTKPLLSNALTQQRHPDSIAVAEAKEMATQLRANIFTHSPVQSIDINSKEIVFTHNFQQLKKIHYSHLVLANGAKKNRLLVNEALLDSLFSVNSLQDYKKFHDHIDDKTRVKIIGSGLVGCEFANDLINVGKQVEVISNDEFPLARFIPEALGRALQEALQQAGVKWNFNTAFNEEEIDAQTAILSAIGLRANTKLAAQANIYCEKGICVDAYLRTNQENIYAIGDCAQIVGQLQQFVAPITHCAKALAKTLAGELTPVEMPPLPVIVKTPACPIAFLNPKTQSVSWQIKGSGKNWQALSYDKHNNLRGFALSGDHVKERVKLAKNLAVNPLFTY